MSDLFGNHIVGFPTRRLIFYVDSTHITKAVCHSNKTYTKKPVSMPSVAMETLAKVTKMLFFKIFNIFLPFLEL